MLVLGLVCFVLMGISEAVMDTLQFHFFKSIFSNFKKQLFWDLVVRNKYRTNPDRLKFPFSTTLLVGLTDGWHQLLRNLFLSSLYYFWFYHWMVLGSLLWFVSVGYCLVSLMFYSNVCLFKINLLHLY